MNAQEFTYWLNGFVELTGNDVPPTEAQWKSIREHLNLVFNKVTPAVEQPDVQKTAPQTQITAKELEEIARRFRENVAPPPTPFEYPPYIDPFKTPQTYPDWVFPGYDPTRTIITC